LKNPGRVKERYDFSFDARQLGLVLMAVAAIAAIVFALGVSVGVQWERKSDGTSHAAMAAASRHAPKAQAATPPGPAAPPVLAPVTTAKARPDKAPGKADEAKAPVSLTFPKVLTSNTRNTAPLVPEKKTEGRARKYTVQAGAYSEKGAAKARADKLRKKGYDAKVYYAGGKKGYAYKVRVGSFTSHAEAVAEAKKLQTAEKVSPYITFDETQEVGR
jgi:cell division protein FtsN